MSNSEDYLDGLLDSITEKKASVKESAETERRQRSARVRERNRVKADDDFMEANGLKGFKPKKVGRNNLRSAFSEADFLKDFEEELESGEYDEFLDDFERELRGDDDLYTDESDEEMDLDLDDELGDDQDSGLDDLTDMPDISDDDLSMDDLPADELPTDELPMEELPAEDLSGNTAESVDDILSGARQQMEEGEEGLVNEEFLQPEFQPDELDAPEDNGMEGMPEMPDMPGMPEMPEEMDLSADMEGMPAILDENDVDTDLSELMASGEFEDIENLLNADENGQELEESRESFEAAADGVSLEAVGAGEEQEKKGGFFGKLISAITGIFKKGPKDEEDEEDEDEAPVGEEELLASYQDAEAAKKSKKEAQAEAKKKAKEEKEKAKKEKAAEKEKAAKAKAEAKKKAQEEKAKKKAAKPKEKQAKIPIKSIIPFVLLAASIIIMILVAANVLSKKRYMTEAQQNFNKGDYIEAYYNLGGLKLKTEEDVDFQTSVHLLAELQLKYTRCETFMKMKKYDMALDELINGYGRYEFNAEEAAALGISMQYDGMGAVLRQQLSDQFGVSTERAVELYNISTDDRREYSAKLYEILEALGMVGEDWN